MKSNAWRSPNGGILTTIRCRHEVTSHEEMLHSEEWSRAAELRQRAIRLEGVSVERCVGCEAIRVQEPATDDSVENLLRLLASVTRGGAVARTGAPKTPAAASAEVRRGPLPQSWRARPPELDLSNLVLAAVTRNQLEEALAKLRYHKLIYEDWGFNQVDRTGRAATLCLYGPPGTGKTRAAEALAGTLGAPFLAIASGDVESRYMGESAKNVQAIFAAAEKQKAVLFFDEADSLFGKRASEVTQGVDHEVNVTKSMLLVEVEKFSGLLVLATNFERNLDPAFRRRISWTIEFVKPDAEARHALWEMHIPAGVPLAVGRTALIGEAVAASEGLTGGDVLTAMRIALASVVRVAGENGSLAPSHLRMACDSIRKAEASLRGTHRSGAVARELMVGSGPAPTPELATREPGPPGQEV